MTSKLPSQSTTPRTSEAGPSEKSRRRIDVPSGDSSRRAAGRPRATLKDGLTPIVDELVRRGITLAQARREFERQLIEASIRSTRGNMGRAARSLGVHRNTLRNKVTDLGIEPRRVVEKTNKRS